MNGRQGKIKTVLLVYLVSVCSFALGVRACECVPGCSYSACEACEEGVCVYQCDSANCETCFEGSCIECFYGGVCCDGTCCESCCDGITCYSPATEVCCGDGYGTVCSGSFPCCLDVPGHASLCSVYCHDSVCCGAGQYCCDNGCCDSPCCGSLGCCGADKFCCGDTECCDAGEQCCYDPVAGESYCNPPCWDEVVDSTTCAKSHEPDYKCPGCTLIVGTQCEDITYRDYTGLIQKECHDGCPLFDWNIETKECYIERECAYVKTLENHMCIECKGELVCAPCDLSSCMCGEPSIPGCVLNVACTLIGTCVKCGTGGKVVDTFKKETCNCK
jgi:hypothetical protein